MTGDIKVSYCDKIIGVGSLPDNRRYNLTKAGSNKPAIFNGTKTSVVNNLPDFGEGNWVVEDVRREEVE